jgi:hypothetical protein
MSTIQLDVLGAALSRAWSFQKMSEHYAKMLAVHYDTPSCKCSPEYGCVICGLPASDHPETAVPGIRLLCDRHFVHF